MASKSGSRPSRLTIRASPVVHRSGYSLFGVGNGGVEGCQDRFLEICYPETDSDLGGEQWNQKACLAWRWGSRHRGM